MLHELTCPGMREELTEALRALSDVAYQQMAWVRHVYPSGIQHDELDYAIHLLFDDLQMQEDPGIGEVLWDEREASAVSAVMNALDEVFNVHGTRLSDEEYISTKEWEGVVATADHAYKLLTANDKGP